VACVDDEIPFVRAWIMARCPEFEGRVYPVQAIQDDKPPYCVLTVIDGERYREQSGPETMVRCVVRVDIWGVVRKQATTLSKRIAGDVDNPGFDGWRGPLVAVDVVGEMFVERVNMLGLDIDDYQEPEQGQSQGWYRKTREYVIYYNEELV
jgi:hypothetical protein